MLDRYGLDMVIVRTKKKIANMKYLILRRSLSSGKKILVYVIIVILKA